MEEIYSYNSKEFANSKNLCYDVEVIVVKMKRIRREKGMKEVEAVNLKKAYYVISLSDLLNISEI